jgi:hypothetical protein
VNAKLFVAAVSLLSVSLLVSTAVRAGLVAAEGASKAAVSETPAPVTPVETPASPLAAEAPAPQPEPETLQIFKAEQLDQLLAPIALYPDTLLVQILMAATYPLEIVKADRWLQDPSTVFPK